MSRLTRFCLTLTILAAGSVHAQADSLWSRTYGGANEDECNSLVQTADRGYALAGHTISFGAGNSDFYLVRTDENGDSLWSRTYGSGSLEGCTCLIQTADGGFALGGEVYPFGVGNWDFHMVRTDENGESLWSRTYGGGRDDKCYSLVQTADGGFALAGSTGSFGAGSNDFWLVKTGENGDSLWSHTYGGQGVDECHSVIQTLDGGFALAGYTESFGAGWSDFWLVRTNENGDSVWSRTYGSDSQEACNSLIQTTDGGFALAGLTRSFGAGYWDFDMVRTDEDGNGLWSRTYGRGDADGCNSLVRTSDGGYALAGSTNSFGAGSRDFCLVRTNENGDSLWSRAFGGGGNEECKSLVQTSDGGFALAGYTESFGAGNADFWLVRLGPENSVPGDGAPAPLQFSLDGVYPNPFNQSTVVSYQLSVPGEVSLSLFDLSGRLISNQKSVISNPGSHRAVIDGSHLPSGIYPILLTAGHQSAMSKMCLIR